MDPDSQLALLCRGPEAFSLAGFLAQSIPSGGDRVPGSGKKSIRVVLRLHDGPGRRKTGDLVSDDGWGLFAPQATVSLNLAQSVGTLDAASTAEWRCLVADHCEDLRRQGITLRENCRQAMRLGDGISGTLVVPASAQSPLTIATINRHVAEAGRKAAREAGSGVEFGELGFDLELGQGKFSDKVVAQTRPRAIIGPEDRLRGILDQARNPGWGRWLFDRS
jgi:hypothetical protein